MTKLQFPQDVSVDEVRTTLESGLGSRYRVAVSSDSTLKVGRPGVIPSQVRVRHAGGATTVTVQTTGLIVSRVIQAASINPRVRSVLRARYGGR